MIGRFPVANHPAVVLFDSGASHSFISRTFVIKHKLPMGELTESFCILSPGGRINTKEVVRSIPVMLGEHVFPTTMIVLRNQEIDVILGMNWMCQYKAMIDILNRVVRVDIPNSTSKLILQLPMPLKPATTELNAT
ncbi:aspartyl protease family protein, partial [Haemophilus sp. SZY H56]